MNWNFTSDIRNLMSKLFFYSSSQGLDSITCSGNEGEAIVSLTTEKLFKNFQETLFRLKRVLVQANYHPSLFPHGATTPFGVHLAYILLKKYLISATIFITYFSILCTTLHTRQGTLLGSLCPTLITLRFHTILTPT